MSYKKITELTITFIGEEWSDDISVKRESPVKEFVDKLKKGGLKIEYKACDMPIEDQTKNSILKSKNNMEESSSIPVGQEVKGDLGKYLAETHQKNELEIQRKNRMREPFWYENIKNKTNENMIFICGLSHISTQNDDQEGFDKLLIEKGCKVQVLRVF